MLHVNVARPGDGLLKTEDAEQLFYCKLCDIQCTNADNFENHTAGNKHCKKFLAKQNDLGFEEFEGLFGDVLFSKRCQTHPQPGDKELYALHVYRSGLLNKFTCRACGEKTFQMSKWFEHIYSWKHGQKIQHLQQTMTRTLFLNQFGDIPGPNPKLFSDNSGTSNGTQQNMTSELDQNKFDAMPNALLTWIASFNNTSVPGVEAGATSSSEDLRSQPVYKSSASTSSSSSREQRSVYDDAMESKRQQRHSRRDDVAGRSKRDTLSPRKRTSKRHEKHYDKTVDSDSDNGSSDKRRRRSEKSSRSRQQLNGTSRDREPERKHKSSFPSSCSSNPAILNGTQSTGSLFHSTNELGTKSDDVLRRTLYEFVTDIVKKQPEASPSCVFTDEQLFALLPPDVQRHVYNVHVVSRDSSITRCIGAVKFLLALDPSLLESVSRFLQEDHPRLGHTAHTSD